MKRSSFYQAVLLLRHCTTVFCNTTTRIFSALWLLLKYSDCLDGNPWVQRFPPSGPALPVSRPQPSSTALHHHLPICGKTSRSCSSSLVQRARETAKQVAEVWDRRSAGLLEMKAWGKKNIQQKSSVRNKVPPAHEEDRAEPA